MPPDLARSFEFTIILDCSPGSVGPIVTLAFDRKAESLALAVGSAIADVESAGYAVARIEIARAGAVTASPQQPTPSQEPPMSHDPRCAVDKLESEGLSHEAAIDALRQKEQAQLAKHGWISHYVFDDPDTPTGINVHTHGLAENYGHPDFQLVLPLATETAWGILANLVDDVKAGRVFSAGTTAGGIIRDYNLGFAAASEGGRDVLRVIVPDPEGRTARGEIGGEYAVQYEGTR
jgi:hypothetical protein